MSSTKCLFKNLNPLLLLTARSYSLNLLPFSTSVLSASDFTNRSSFTVNYLINSCGLTPERALSSSKHVKFKAADKPDSVLAFFKDHSFTQTQTSKVVNCFPHVLVSNPDKTLLPKLDFLKSKGFSDSDIAEILSKWPQILMRSLENQLIPSFNFFKSFLLSNGRTNITSFKRCAGVLLFDLEKHGAQNIQMLKIAGVPLRNIESFLARQPRMFMTKCEYFRAVVDEVTKMGFAPFNLQFMIAIHTLRSMTKPTWDRKVKLYRKWGWSKDDIFAAFRKYPICMTVSENKICLVMDFWVNKMGWKSSLLANRPTVLSYSLEKRIAPRSEVYMLLVSSGLLDPTKFSFASMLNISETHFLEKFVDPHSEKAPALLKLYKVQAKVGSCQMNEE